MGKIKAFQASYVASTKYKLRNKNGQPSVSWRRRSSPSNRESVRKMDEEVAREDYLYKDKPLFGGINQEIMVIKEFINHHI